MLLDGPGWVSGTTLSSVIKMVNSEVKMKNLYVAIHTEPKSIQYLEFDLSEPLEPQVLLFSAGQAEQECWCLYCIIKH